LLLLRLLLLLLLFLFCQMMPDSATGRRANDAMMARHVPSYAPYYGTLDATFRLGTVRADQEHKTQQGCGKHLHLRCHTLRHTITPSCFGPMVIAHAGLRTDSSTHNHLDVLRTPQFAQSCTFLYLVEPGRP
jgi:hypothetical protein